jgi:predicted lysophospholipase L1 biosynthesis ABC-type transport system permease subunit
VLVEQRFVRRYFADADPVGRRINLGSVTEPDWREIVGVVGDVTNEPPPDAPQPTIYMPFSQEDFPYYGVVARTDGDPSALAATMRDVVASIDRDQPVSYPMSLSSLVSDAFAVERTSTIILSFFAVLAVVLAAMGVYGVLAHHVLERRHDLAIRLALGASRRHLLGYMLRRLALMTGGGLAVGVAGALATARVLQSLLYRVSAHDPALLAAVALLLALVALAAGWIPLRRAVRTDPMAALREQ